MVAVVTTPARSCCPPVMSRSIDSCRMIRRIGYSRYGADKEFFRTRLDRVPVLRTFNEEEAGVGVVLVGVAPIVRYVRLEGTLNIAHC